MSWTLKIHSPTGTLQKTLSDTASAGISGGFKWQRRGTGDCVQLEFDVINATAGIGPRAIITLDVSGVRQFWGVAVDPPSLLSRDIETLQVVGGRELLTKRLVDHCVHKNATPFVIATDLLTRLNHPVLTSAVTPHPNVGNLELYYSPQKPLAEALDDLAKTAGHETVWGVDAMGVVFFRPKGTTSTTITQQRGWRYLHTQDREVCTRAIVRTLSAPKNLSSLSYGAHPFDPRTPPAGVHALHERGGYIPASVSMSAEHTEHSTYGAEKSAQMPAEQAAFFARMAHIPLSGMNLSGIEGLNANGPSGFILQSGVDAWRLNGNSFDLSDGVFGTTNGTQFFGVRFKYSSDAKLMGVRLRHYYKHTDGSFTVAYGWGWPTSGYKIADFWLPPDARQLDARWIMSEFDFYGREAGYAEIDDVEFFLLNQRVVGGYAQSLLRTPYASPAEVEVFGLLSPTPQVSALGQTADALIWDYEHTPEHPTTTRIRFGADGQNPTARAIKFARKGEL